MGFRLIPILITSNDVQRLGTPIVYTTHCYQRVLSAIADLLAFTLTQIRRYVKKKVKDTPLF